jgi:hypothetical protein
MKTIIFITVILILILLFVKLFVFKKNMPAGIESIDRGQYELLLGCDAKQVFLHYRVVSMHGLSLTNAEDRIAEGGSYIDGLCNYHPRDRNLDKNPLPFLFLNIKSLQNNYSNHEVYTCIMHECMHMAGLIYDGCWDSHEEEMVTWAEAEANRIIVLLKKKKFI